MVPQSSMDEITNPHSLSELDGPPFPFSTQCDANQYGHLLLDITELVIFSTKHVELYSNVRKWHFLDEAHGRPGPLNTAVFYWWNLECGTGHYSIGRKAVV